MGDNHCNVIGLAHLAKLPRPHRNRLTTMARESLLMAMLHLGLPATCAIP